MAFRTKTGEFFTGRVVDPEGDREVVVVGSGTRAAAIHLTIREAHRRNWDWHIDLKRRVGDEDATSEILASWSSLVGDLPPDSRSAVPDLK